jgi:hypothetical protein
MPPIKRRRKARRRIAALSEPQKQLYALGRFVLCFAEVERVLLLNLCSIGGVSDEFARAALSGVRADAATDYIRRFFEVTNAEKAKRDAYNELFVHLKLINGARNLIHAPWYRLSRAWLRGKQSASRIDAQENTVDANNGRSSWSDEQRSDQDYYLIGSIHDRTST